MPNNKFYKRIVKLLCISLVFMGIPSLASEQFVKEGNEAAGTRVEQHLERIRKKNLQSERKHIVVIGAGIAGLTAALELKSLGHDVKIIEASARVGGRIWTHTFDSTKEYGELGAMRIPASHDYTHHYIAVAGLREHLRPFVTAHDNSNCFYHLRGKPPVRMRESSRLIKEEYQVSPHEDEVLASDAPPRILRMHLSNALRLLQSKGMAIPKEDKVVEEWGGLFGDTFLNDYALELEGLSLGEFLDKRLESKGAKELIGVSTGLELWWDKALTMFLREEITRTGHELQEIAGGLGRLPDALAQMLRKKEVSIIKSTEVTSIEIFGDSEHKIKLKTRPTDSSKWDSPPTKGPSHDEPPVDFVICTIPFGVLRLMDLKGFSPQKMEAIRNLSIASASKVLLNCTDRFWERGSREEQILGGASMSDQITRCTYYPSDHAEVKPPVEVRKQETFCGAFTVSNPLKIERHHKSPLRNESMPGVLLGSYNWGQDAIRLGTMPPDEQAEVVIASLENFHPEIRQYIHPEDAHKCMFWDSYPWSRGAFCGMRPNDMKKYHHASKQPEGNVFFAGEHCSLDPGWIQGAIKSALDAVEGIVDS